MLFNSIEYLLFLPTVLIIYWSLQKNLKLQNLFILIASYFFYGLWDYRFLSLIIISTLADYLIGLTIPKQESKSSKKRLLLLSLFINLGFLFIFKYYNFFIGSFTDLLDVVGIKYNPRIINIVLPVGISFYTFQTLSYTIDIYNKNLTPTKSLLNFATYVAFFPQLVAGPIERAKSLLPQIENPRFFSESQTREGLRYILWGLFKKVVIADNAAIYVDAIFENSGELNGWVLFIGAILFVFQIYGDFSGYSDIAIGTAKLLGFNLMQNFATPYFSVNTTDFWRRWHISLSTWFRDYIFTPLILEYRSYKKQATYFATFITFLLLGIWHGGNWTFFVFGLMQSIVLCFEIYTKKFRKKFKKSKKHLLGYYYFFSWSLTMLFWILGMVVFRATNIGHALNYVKRMFQAGEISFYKTLANLSLNINYLVLTTIFIGLMLSIEWVNRREEHSLQKLPKLKVFRYPIYLFLSLLIIQYFSANNAFIYFQF